VRRTRLATREIIAKPSGNAVGSEIVLRTTTLFTATTSRSTPPARRSMRLPSSSCAERISDGIQRPVLRAQPLLHSLGDHRMRLAILIWINILPLMIAEIFRLATCQRMLSRCN
jgi:hypothetical protein